MSMNYTGLLILLLALVVLVGLPVLCIVAGVVRLKTLGWRSARVLLTFGTGVLGFYLALLVAYIVSVGPWRSGILTQGKLPEGREFCVVQSFKDMFEPYQVSFYVRDEAGVWHWNYLEHEDVAWRTAAVTFSNSVAYVSRNGVPFDEVVLPAKPVDMDQVQPGYRNHYCPATFTVEDVLEFHNERYQK